MPIGEKIKKAISFIISLIMMFSAVGCMDKDTGLLSIYPDSSNSTIDIDADSKEDESSADDSVSGDDSSSNENDNKPSKE